MLLATTKIEAINTILSSIGEAPIDVLEENDNVDVSNALRLLDSNSRTVQAKGWDFNSYKNYELIPDKNTNQIRYNKSFIHFKATDGNTYVKRGDLLYDMSNNTNLFKSPILLNVIVAVDFEDLPDCFKTYVVAQTALKFQQRYLGDEGMSQDLAIAAQEAYTDIVEYDLAMSNYNMLNFTGVAEALART